MSDEKRKISMLLLAAIGVVEKKWAEVETFARICLYPMKNKSLYNIFDEIYCRKKGANTTPKNRNCRKYGKMEDLPAVLCFYQ